MSDLPDFDLSHQNLKDDTVENEARAYIAEQIEGRRKTLQWDHLVAAASILPEMEISTYQLIRYCLGYLPESHITLPHEPFIRTLLNNYRWGGTSVDELLFKQAEEHLLAIRNKDIQSDSCLHYHRDDYQKYFGYLPGYADKVKQRLEKFLGYEPYLEHSLMAELQLRTAMTDDRNHFGDQINDYDLRAITIIGYREVLLRKGKDEADKSPLIDIKSMII